MIRTYSELILLPTFEERFEYLKLKGGIGESTFGFDRYLNQALYTSKHWQRLRRRIIIRDEACDLGIVGREISDRIIIHHMNPVTRDEILHRSDSIFNPENLICTTFNTHNAIHFGNAESLKEVEPITRKPRDTILW